MINYKYISFIWLSLLLSKGAQRREHARPKTEAELQIEADKNEEIQLKRKEKEETGMVEQEDVEDETDALQFETYEPTFTKGRDNHNLN